MTDDLHNQFRRAIAMLRFTIEEFEEKEWTAGITWFFTPARLALHTALALEAYFFYRPDSGYAPSIDLVADWAQLTNQQLPNQSDVLVYLADLERRIDEVFGSLSEEELGAPTEFNDYWGKTLLGRYAYALRHTMHHQGALTVLATHHGHEGECWR
jgi:hypothetical protein